MLKVQLSGETIQAKLGSMVAYQGDVKFEHAGSRRAEADGEEGGHRRGRRADEDLRARARSSSPTWRRRSSC